jgi:Peptidase_C39 like family
MKSRYIPFTQQPYCCVPACLQMVMYRRGIPLLPQEDIANELGLVVPKEDLHLFEKARTGERPPSGWGTQIGEQKYEINKALSRLEVPLKAALIKTDVIQSAQNLQNEIANALQAGKDVLVCFSYGKLWNTDSMGGHVCVIDRIENDTVWLVDPGQNVPKHRQVNIDSLYEAIKYHADENKAQAPGLWVIEPAT